MLKNKKLEDYSKEDWQIASNSILDRMLKRDKKVMSKMGYKQVVTKSDNNRYVSWEYINKKTGKKL